MQYNDNGKLISVQLGKSMEIVHPPTTAAEEEEKETMAFRVTS